MGDSAAGHDAAVDAVRHVTAAADYLAGLARQLQNAGIDGRDSVSVVRMLRDEAQGLLAELGGNTRRRL